MRLGSAAAPSASAVPASAVPASAVPASAVPAAAVPATAVPATAVPAAAVAAAAVAAAASGAATSAAARAAAKATFIALTVMWASALTPSFAAAPTGSSALPRTTAVCAHNAAAAPAVARLRDAMEHGRFVAYEPATRQIVNGIPTRADPDVIRDDLKVLRARFDSLITYTAVNGEEVIPTIATSLGYRALIIGVYDPFNATELNAAVAAARANPKLVVGLSLGNELVFFHRHSAAEMEKLFDTVRGEIPQVALATTEPFHVFYPADTAPLLKRMDLLLPNVHPIFEPWFRTASDEDASQFVVNVVSKLAESYCGPILVKETGIPTAPESKGYTEARQASFYQTLQQRFTASTGHASTGLAPTGRAFTGFASTGFASTGFASTGHASTGRAFTYFEAFDTPWRLSDYGPQGQRPALEEAHWGLYDERRQPKAVVAVIPPLTSRH